MALVFGGTLDQCYSFRQLVEINQVSSLKSSFPFAEKELLDSLPLSKKCPEDQELLRFLFENKLKKVNGVTDIHI